MSTVGANSRCTAWCELVVAYGWTKGDDDILALAERFPPSARESAVSLSKALEKSADGEVRRRFEEVLTTAGISFIQSRTRR